MQPQLPLMEIEEIDSELMDEMRNSSVVKEENKVIFVKEDLVFSNNGVNSISNPLINFNLCEIDPNFIEEKETIGRGQAAIVKRGLYRSNNIVMQVAVKSIFINEKQRQEKSKRDQLINDLRTYLGPSSKYLVKLYGCYYEDGYVKQIAQYMDMGSLGTLIKHVRKNNMVIHEYVLAQMTSQILQGLHWIHKIKHQIHRDIKPQNILMNIQGEVKVADFGISKGLANTFCKTHTFIGTAIYMSPERAAFLDYNYKCDIWSVGLVLWELATRLQLPYSVGKDNPLQLISRIIDKPAPELPIKKFTAQFCNFIHQWYGSNLCVSLQKDPQKRSSCDQLLKHPWLQKNLNRISLVDFMKQIKNIL